MPSRDETSNLRVEFDTHQEPLAEHERDKMERDLAQLRRVVRDFPLADLHVDVLHHPRSNGYHVKTRLTLPNRILFTGDRDVGAHPAYKRCIRKLVKKVEGYKDAMDGRQVAAQPSRSMGQQMVPAWEPDVAAMREAVDAGDYAAFRRQVSAWSDAVRLRAGRWVERYPTVAAALGQDVFLVEIVEETFLNAFERFGEYPGAPRTFGQWLEELIDRSIRDFAEDPEGVKQNLSFIDEIKE